MTWALRLRFVCLARRLEDRQADHGKVHRPVGFRVLGNARSRMQCLRHFRSNCPSRPTPFIRYAHLTNLVRNDRDCLFRTGHLSEELPGTSRVMASCLGSRLLPGVGSRRLAFSLPGKHRASRTAPLLVHFVARGLPSLPVRHSLLIPPRGPGPRSSLSSLSSLNCFWNWASFRPNRAS